MFNGQRLRKLRKQMNLTMKEFGEKFKLAESTISGYENESRKPDLETVDKFANFFDVSADYLMGRTDTPKTIGHAYMGGGSDWTDEEKAIAEATIEAYRKRKQSK